MFHIPCKKTDETNNDKYVMIIYISLYNNISYIVVLPCMVWAMFVSCTLLSSSLGGFVCVLC